MRAAIISRVLVPVGLASACFLDRRRFFEGAAAAGFAVAKFVAAPNRPFRGFMDAIVVLEILRKRESEEGGTQGDETQTENGTTVSLCLVMVSAVHQTM